MPSEMPKVYEGNHDFAFICYAHADRGVVLPIIAKLVAEGYRVWYDDGIEIAEDYPEYIADHIRRCASFVTFISSSFLDSRWCKDEVNYALDLGKERILPIYLDEDAELTPGLEMRMGRRQAMFWYEFDSDEAFYRKLFKARRLESCLTPKGKERRGVKQKGGGSKLVQAAQATGPVSDELRADERRNDEAGAVDPQPAGRRASRVGDATPGDAGTRDMNADSGNLLGDDSPANREYFVAGGEVDGVAAALAVDEDNGTAAARAANGTGDARSAAPDDEGASLGDGPANPVEPDAADDGSRSHLSWVVPKKSFADYSWAELKEISRLIAAVGSDVTGLAVAKKYSLADKSGRLRGETRAVTLRDGTRTSIRILGFRHDNLAGGGKAGISFEFANVPAKHRMNPHWPNEGGWETSEMRGWLNDGRSGFLSLLPDDLRSLVETASKRTNNRGSVRENDTACVTATDDRLWLLSMSEVYGKLSAQKRNVPWSPATYDAEGEQYKLYADKGVSTSSYDFCKKDGADSWWLRSPHATDTDRFRLVRVDGDWYWFSDAGHEWGVSPGFCF